MGTRGSHPLASRARRGCECSGRGRADPVTSRIIPWTRGSRPHASRTRRRRVRAKRPQAHAIVLASRSGNVVVVRILLQRGADGAARRGDGLTVLHLALRWGRARLLACLWSMWVRTRWLGMGRVDSV